MMHMEIFEFKRREEPHKPRFNLALGPSEGHVFVSCLHQNMELLKVVAPVFVHLELKIFSVNNTEKTSAKGSDMRVRVFYCFMKI